MSDSIKYIFDESGNKTSVLVPIKIWEDLNGDYQKLQQKLLIMSSIEEGLKEVKQAKRTGKKLQTLKDFLK